jgi:hypothetical protein
MKPGEFQIVTSAKSQRTLKEFVISLFDLNCTGKERKKIRQKDKFPVSHQAIFS